MKALVLFSILFYFVSGDIDLQNVEIPEVNIDDFSAIREKCDKAGGPGTYDKLKTSKEELQTCVTQFANVSVVQDELEEAKKTGSMDEVFGKYCAKRPKLATCVQSFTDNLRPCLNNDENKALNITLDILKQLGDFVCYKNGDRIAMFIAEGGVECINNRTEGIKNCVNSTLKIAPATVNTNSLPNLLMDKKKCDDFGKLQNCVVEELEKCKDSTPANIIDALFRFVKRSACTNKNKRSVAFHNIIRRSVTHFDFIKIKNNILNIFKEKCKQNAPDGGFEAFELTLQSATHCVWQKTTQNIISSVSSDTYKEDIQRCVRKLIEKTEACLPEDEKYWPRFNLDTFLNVVDVFYKNKIIITGIPFRMELVNCFQNLNQEPAKQNLAKCLEIQPSNNLQKDVICERLSNMTSCFSNQIQKTCTRDITVKKIFDDLFHAMTALCEDKDKVTIY